MDLEYLIGFDGAHDNIYDERETKSLDIADVKMSGQ